MLSSASISSAVLSWECRYDRIDADMIQCIIVWPDLSMTRPHWAAIELKYQGPQSHFPADNNKFILYLRRL